MSVWDDLVGQESVAAELAHAASTDQVGHAWLIVGPPGSGRSNAARAFAAALECPDRGCGVCNDCRSTLAGSHHDVTYVNTETVSLQVKETRELIHRAAMSPVRGRHQILVVEDADRLTEKAADALLKSVEEPADRTVWMLCAPTVDDVPVTIRSRCRVVSLRTPSVHAVATMLRDRLAVDPAVAAFAARASQGHIGRARALATNDVVRERRAEVLAIPAVLVDADLAHCLAAAATLVEAASAEAAATATEVDASEKEHLRTSMGFAEERTTSRHVRAAMRALEENQKARAKRMQRDALDRALLDLSAFYRDALTVGMRAGAELVNEELTGDVTRVAEHLGPVGAMRCNDAISRCRERLTGNVAPLIAMEALMVELRTAA